MHLVLYQSKIFNIFKYNLNTYNVIFYQINKDRSPFCCESKIYFVVLETGILQRHNHPAPVC